jgi:RHS repeat-associated protein
MPFGEVRAEVGTISQTDFSFTGQRSVSMLSIMDYIARFYDPAIGRFLQPDTIIPSPANP